MRGKNHFMIDCSCFIVDWPMFSPSTVQFWVRKAYLSFFIQYSYRLEQNERKMCLCFSSSSTETWHYKQNWVACAGNACTVGTSDYSSKNFWNAQRSGKKISSDVPSLHSVPLHFQKYLKPHLAFACNNFRRGSLCVLNTIAVAITNG